MIEPKLKDIAPEDIDDVLDKVEKSFNIKFSNTELRHISTFGELCDHIIQKIELENSDDCTTQQAFYKLCDAISTTLLIDRTSISPSSSLVELLPRPNRRSIMKKLEQNLGFQLKILRPPHWISGTLAILSTVSFIGIFFFLEFGLLGFIFSIVGFWFVNTIGKELDLETVGELAQEVSREHYLFSRRNPKTYNKNEIEKVLSDLFHHDLYIDKSNLNREATFV